MSRLADDVELTRYKPFRSFRHNRTRTRLETKVKEILDLN